MNIITQLKNRKVYLPLGSQVSIGRQVYELVYSSNVRLSHIYLHENPVEVLQYIFKRDTRHEYRWVMFHEQLGWMVQENTVDSTIFHLFDDIEYQRPTGYTKFLKREYFNATLAGTTFTTGPQISSYWLNKVEEVAPLGNYPFPVEAKYPHKCVFLQTKNTKGKRRILFMDRKASEPQAAIMKPVSQADMKVLLKGATRKGLPECMIQLKHNIPHSHVKKKKGSTIIENKPYELFAISSTTILTLIILAALVLFVFFGYNNEK